MFKERKEKKKEKRKKKKKDVFTTLLLALFAGAPGILFRQVLK